MVGQPVHLHVDPCHCKSTLDGLTVSYGAVEARCERDSVRIADGRAHSDGERYARKQGFEIGGGLAGVEDHQRWLLVGGCDGAHEQLDGDLTSLAPLDCAVVEDEDVFVCVPGEVDDVRFEGGEVVQKVVRGDVRSVFDADQVTVECGSDRVLDPSDLLGDPEFALRRGRGVEDAQLFLLGLAQRSDLSA